MWDNHCTCTVRHMLHSHTVVCSRALSRGSEHEASCCRRAVVRLGTQLQREADTCSFHDYCWQWLPALSERRT
jgi:hypothetical protein